MRHNSALFCTQAAPQFGSALYSCLLTAAAAAVPVKFFLVFAYHPEKVGAKTNVHKSYKKKPVRFKVNVISRGFLSEITLVINVQL